MPSHFTGSYGGGELASCKPVWFLGLCQLLRGRASPSLAILGRAALIGSVLIIVTAFVTYALSYRRCFTRIPETSDIGPANSGTRMSWIFRILDRTILTSAFQRAGYRFVINTLLRSEHHGLVLGGFFGLGIVTASQFLFAAFSGKNVEAGSLPSAEVLAVPLILSYCIILGVRFVFDIPTEIRANWVFRLSLDKAGHECVPLARKVILTFVFPWMFAIAFPLYGFLWGWRAGLLQTGVVSWPPANRCGHSMVGAPRRNLASPISQGSLHLFLSTISGFRRRSCPSLRPRVLCVCNLDFQFGALGLAGSGFDCLVDCYCAGCRVRALPFSAANRRR